MAPPSTRHAAVVVGSDQVRPQRVRAHVEGQVAETPRRGAERHLIRLLHVARASPEAEAAAGGAGAWRGAGRRIAQPVQGEEQVAAAAAAGKGCRQRILYLCGGAGGAIACHPCF